MFNAASIRNWLGILCYLVAMASWKTHAQPATKEYQIKAAFLFNFAQFVEWPTNAFATTNSPLTIGVLGENPFGGALEDIVHGETIHGRPLMVRHSQTVSDLNDCQMIFISKSEKGRVAEILSALDSRPVLTISEFEGFARRGGIINFYLDGKKVRFSINASAAKNHDLKMSSELLNLGKIVKTSPKGVEK
ncbi:MAG TPA: YfiR family protein [Verrucomicrobiae bacterium]|jgi:hypothetical protein|nr:YfiR family protein [Verrucomicrobiae bacterium]